MTDVFDFDVYLRRIGLSRGGIEAHAPQSFSLMRAIAWGQATHIPFENLSALYPGTMRVVHPRNADDDALTALEQKQRAQTRSSLDPADIYQKLVLSNRGGFCFEQNLLLARALREAAFQVDLIAARGVLRGGDETRDGFALSCFTHLVLIASTMDGKKYLVDDGFGWAGAPRQPLELADGLVIEDAGTGEMFRLVRGDVVPSVKEGADLWGCHRFRVGRGGTQEKSRSPDCSSWFLQYKNCAQAAEFWDMYHFSEEARVSAIDCEPGAWYASTNPYHRQTQIKLVAVMTNDGRTTLVDDILTIRKGGGTVVERELNGASRSDELRNVMKECFNIDLAL